MAEATDLSVWRRIQTGEWKQVSGGWLAVAATAGIVLDIVTTAYILFTPGFVELNAVVAGIAATSPWLGIAYFTAGNLLFLPVIWLNGGWVSDVTAIFKAIVNTALGLNNLLLFSIGYSVYGTLGAVTGLVLIEGVAFTGIGAYLYRYRDAIPLREFIIVGTAGVLLTAVLFVLET